MPYFSKVLGGVVGIGMFAAAMSSAHAVPSTVAGTVISNGSVTVTSIDLFDVIADSAQGAIEFSIGTLTNPVSSAILQVFDSPTAFSLPGSSTVNVAGYTGDGALTFAGDFNPAGATAIGSFSYVDGTPTPFSIDVTAFVNTLIGTENFVGFNLQVAGLQEFVGLVGQGGSPDTNPQLILTAGNGNGDQVSEPGAMALFGIGMLGICVAASRRKRRAT